MKPGNTFLQEKGSNFVPFLILSLLLPKTYISTFEGRRSVWGVFQTPTDRHDGFFRGQIISRTGGCSADCEER